MNTPTPSLSPSEKRTLQQVANRAQDGVGWDWVALQRLIRMGLVANDRTSGPTITEEGRRTLQRLMLKA